MSTVTSGERTERSLSPKSMAIWGAIALVGAACWAVLALSRGEEVSALWMLFAALSSYAIAYRFYARFGCVRRSLPPGERRADVAPRVERHRADHKEHNPQSRCC